MIFLKKILAKYTNFVVSSLGLDYITAPKTTAETIVLWGIKNEGLVTVYLEIQQCSLSHMVTERNT